jgi:hypothetical protein
LNTTNRHLSRARVSSIDKSGGSVRLLKWLVLVALLVLLLLAIFLPDRGLAAPAQRLEQPFAAPSQIGSPRAVNPFGLRI